MSVPPRGARNRRSGRKPGWLLLTALLVLAILASSTIVFSNKVELLRLAVILSLWAAVLAAFVSVVYRRQSELDQARARDMKYVYDLQLDREIAARREYELGVEAHLRRQLTRELRTEANEEMAALRAELVSLRGHLETLLGADLSQRPALESDQFAMASPQLGRVESSRVVIREEILEVTEETITEITAAAETIAEEVPAAAAEAPVPAEPVVAEPVVEEPAVEAPAPAEAASPIIDVPEEPLAPPMAQPVEQPPAPPVPPAPAWQQPEYRGSHRRTQETPAEPVMAPPPPRLPIPPQQPTAPWRPPETQPRRGRHWSAEDIRESAPAEPAVLAAQSDALRVRHREEAPEPADQPVDEAAGQHTGGHSVADLMARLQVNGPVGGGGRRRRED